ncbi:substrate-binding periplasmic protein [Pseudomonas sp.]|uniref:substrate-binding periplasmic protein n=1 Tax=Pseudomonas sp. TaxID=306 RepID=UPI003C784F49
MGVAAARHCRLLRSCCAWLLALLLNVANAAELPVITLSTVDTDDRSTQVMSRVMTAVYRHIGYSLQIVPLPSRRGLAKANAGDYDGELFRVKSISEDFPNLVAVPTPVGVMAFRAFAMRPLPLDGWASLAAYRLGSEMGVKYVEYNTAGMQVSYAPKPEQLFLMLKAGRIDVVVMEIASARMALDELRASGEALAGMQVLGVVDEVELHTFLHRKHAALLPKVDQALREFAAQGLLQRARQLTVEGEAQP